MKPTQITELFANIRKTFVSFFSILMFVALGVGIFVGINWTSPALVRAAESVYDDNVMHHVQVLFPYGLTESDIQEVSQLDGVTSVEKARQAFTMYEQGGTQYTFKLQTVPASIDRLVVQEGELPRRDGEMAVNSASAKELGISVGDAVTFKHDANAQAGNGANGAAGGGTGTASGTPASDSPGDATGSGAGESGGSGMAQLTTDTFKVTAIVDSPEYLALLKATYGFSSSATGSVDALGWVPESAFDDDKYHNGYTVLRIRSEELEQVGDTSFSSEYNQASSQLEERVSKLGETLAPARYDDLHGQAQAKVDEGEAQLAQAQDLITQGEQAVSEGTQKLEEGRATLDQKRKEGEEALAAAYEELQGFERQKAEGELMLAEGRAKIAEGRALIKVVDELKSAAEGALDEAERQWRELDGQQREAKLTVEEFNAALDEVGARLYGDLEPLARRTGGDLPFVTHGNFAEVLRLGRELIEAAEDVPIEYDGQEMTVREARQMLAEAEEQLAAGEAEYEERVAQLEDGWAQYYAGKQTLEEETARGEAELAAGKAQLEDVERQVEEGKAKVAEMKPQLDAGKEQLASMKGYAWTVSGRAANAGALQVSTFSGVTGRLSFSMAALFVIVGLLVSYSAVSRIVHEQITQIGTKKALGLRGREITLSFLLYSAFAVLLGSIIGAVVGCFLVEGIISNALGAQFFMGAFPAYFGVPLFLIVTALELVLVLGATWLACHAILREHAVELLKGEKPPEAKTRFYEKWAVWERLPLFTQTIVNNCVNDKRRVFSTIVGVAGCTALIVTALTLNDDVLDSYAMHYDHVYGFDAIAYTDPAIADALGEAQTVLRDAGATTSIVRRMYYSAKQADGTRSLMQVIVPANDDTFAQLYHLNVMKGEPYDPEGNGVWVTQAFAAHLGAKVGDEVKLDAGDGEVHTVRIAGFYEFYLTYHEMIMGRGLYESEFGTPLAPNAVLADTRGKSVDSLRDILSKKVDGFETLLDDKAAQRVNFDNFAGISRTVVLIYLALATLMAVVVLLNLNVMFIEEKKRDLIVLMINGFSVKDAKRYIYNDTIVLTAVGIALGIALGTVMGSVTVGAIEPGTASFFKGVSWVAVAAGVVGSAVLAFVMSAIALRRIPRFDLTDINRF